MAYGTTGGRGKRPIRRKRRPLTNEELTKLNARHIQGMGANIPVSRAGFFKTAKGVGKGVAHVASGTSRGVYRGITGLPTGVYMSGRGAGHDLRRAAEGDFSFKRSRAIGRAMASATARDFTHFGEGGDISGPLFDVSALFTAGGGAAARTTAAMTAARRMLAESTSPGLDAAVLAKRMGHPMPKERLKRLGVTAKQVDEHDAIHGDRLAGRTLTKRGLGKPWTTSFQTRQAVKAGAQAFARKPVYTRRLKGARGTLTVPASPNPLFRFLAKGGQKLQSTSKSGKIAKRILPDAELIAKKEYLNRERVARQRLGPEPVERKRGSGPLGVALGSPMNILRLAMWARPRYYLQNAAQLYSQLAARPISSAISGRRVAKIRKSDKGLYDVLGRTAGDPLAGSIAQEMVGPGAGLLQKFAHSRVFRAANAPEQFGRRTALVTALRDQLQSMGIKPTAGNIEKFLLGIERQGPLHPVHQAVRRGVSEVGDFNRIYGKELRPDAIMSERAFMRSQIPIFYPMFKALTRYGGRFPSEHALLAALGMGMGRQGKREQERLLGQLPYWAQYLIPTHAGDPNAKLNSSAAVLNPANIYNLQPAGDIARQVAEMGRKGGARPGINLLQEAAPILDIAFGAMRGQDLATGYPLPGVRGHFGGSARAALLNYLAALPGQDVARTLLGGPQRVRSYEQGSGRDRILQELFGPAVTARRLKTKETTKQFKKETSFGKKHKKKHRKKGHHGGGDFGYSG